MWRDCACGLSLGEMEQRMKKVETAEGVIGEGTPAPKDGRDQSRSRSRAPL
jgi:hypothetical protein